MSGHHAWPPPSRPSDAAIARAFYEEIEYNEVAFKPFACVGRPQLARIENRARAIDAEAKDVAGEAGAVELSPIGPSPTAREKWMTLYVIRMMERGIAMEDAWALCRAGESDHDYDSNPSDAADDEISCFEDDGDGPVDHAIASAPTAVEGSNG